MSTSSDKGRGWQFGKGAINTRVKSPWKHGTMSLIGHSLWDSEPQSLNTLCPYNSFHITIHSLYKTPQTSGEQVMCWLPKKPRAAIQHHKAGLSNGVGTRSVGTRPQENLSLAELTFYSQKREGENTWFPKLCLQGCMAKWQSFKACIFSSAPVLLKAKVCIVKSHRWNKQVSFAAVNPRAMAHFSVFSSLTNNSVLKLTNRLLPE